MEDTCFAFESISFTTSSTSSSTKDSSSKSSVTPHACNHNTELELFHEALTGQYSAQPPQLIMNPAHSPNPAIQVVLTCKVHIIIKLGQIIPRQIIMHYTNHFHIEVFVRLCTNLKHCQK